MGSVFPNTYIVKWIRCSVAGGDREAFARAQRQWDVLGREPGFELQIGGWDTKNDDQACILALWATRADYDAFMSARHDAITAASGQAATYHSIAIRLFEVMFEMRGTISDPIDALAAAEVLRVAQCSVHPEREAHFVSVQRDSWAPGMRDAGMSAGLFSAAHDAALPEYLVSSAWPSMAQHTAYLEQHFPRLRAKARVESDVARLEGSLVELEPGWVVRRA